MLAVVSEVQFLKAPTPMVVTESGITFAVNEVQSEKAYHPIFLTVTGSTTDVSNLQSLKARFGISVTPYGTMTAVQSSFFFIFSQNAANPQSWILVSIVNPAPTAFLNIHFDFPLITPSIVADARTLRNDPIPLD